MFTGIVEEIGEIKNIQRGAKSAKLTIKGNVVFQDAKLGDSIAVNGVCLTVTGISGKTFTADVMAESMRRTALGGLHAGSKVNLERAMSANGRFGGHIVSGHIDGTGTVQELKREDNAVWVTIKTEPHILKYIIEKGSIAIDGISLTVAYVDDSVFKVSIIPHTAKETTLLDKIPGDMVNLENDVIGKYVDKLLNFTGDTAGSTKGSASLSNSGISAEFLLKNGYL